jgi:hypothetical protein
MTLVTVPLRKMADLVRWTARLLAKSARGTVRHVKAVIKRILVRMMAEVAKHHSLKSRVVSLVSHYPSLKARLKRLAIASGIVQSPPKTGYDSPLTTAVRSRDLSLRARRIFTDLLDAVERGRTSK